MLALVAFVETAVARRPIDFLDVDDWAYRQNARYAARHARRFDVLCFGDSLVKLSLVPKAVDERSGLRSTNLAVSGSQAPATYALLKRALDGGARPAAVVVDFQPPLLKLGPRHNLNRWANLMSLREAAELARWAGDPGLFATAALGRLLASFHRREAVRANVMAALAGKVDWRPGLNYQFLRHWNVNRGAQLMMVNPAYKTATPEALDEFRRGFYPKFVCHKANARGVERLLALAASRGVTVYWLLPPLKPRIHEGLASSGFDADHEAFIRSWQRRFPNLVVLDGRRTVTDPDGFFDPNHLSAQGAYAFSLAVGDALRQGRRGASGAPASRWVALAPSRPVPLPDGVEDIEQSALALSKGQARR
jgi:hypothetical protein